MSRKLTLIVAFLTASLSSLVFAQAPVTDGLKWDTDMPKAFGVARVSQIQLNGLVDAALYADGAVIAFGLIERIAGGSQGVGWAVVGRVVIAVFFAYCGLAVIHYVAGYAALLAVTWTPDFKIGRAHV